MDIREISADVPEHVTVVHLGANGETVPTIPSVEAALLPPGAARSRRLGFHKGRAAAHEALRRLGRPAAAILRGPYREPLWPDGVVGSITHHAGHALAAVALRRECGGLGIDLEHLDRWFPELEAHTAYGTERALLETLQGDARQRACLEIFSAKESIYKAFFPRVGSFFGFAAAEVKPAPSGRYQGALVAGLDAEFGPNRPFEVGCAWHGELVLTSVVLPP